MQPIIGIAFLKSSGIFGILRASRTPPGGSLGRTETTTYGRPDESETQ